MMLPVRIKTADRASRRARLAVSALFLVNGFTYTSVVPWLPAIKRDLALSNGELGAAIAALPFGAILTGMLAGPLIHRFGSGRAAVGSSVVTLVALPFVALAPHWWAFAGVLFIIGCGDAWTDSAQNAHGLRVQRRYGRTIINTFHAVWSVAAVCGGLLGAAMAGLGVPIELHLSMVAVMLAGILAVASRSLLPGPEHAERADGAGLDGRKAPRPPRPAIALLLLLSVMLMMAGAIEDSAASWGAVYMTAELNASPFVAGLPFVACQAMMTVGRLLGDRVTDRFGAVAVGRFAGLLSAAGMAVSVSAPNQVVTITGFGLMGLGVSTLFPLTLAAAGNVPGVRSGDGVTMVGWLGRLGFLAFPPLVGNVADTTSLGSALWIIVAAGVVAAVLGFALRPRL